jgi:hypothetical protein
VLALIAQGSCSVCQASEIVYSVILSRLLTWLLLRVGRASLHGIVRGSKTRRPRLPPCGPRRCLVGKGKSRRRVIAMSCARTRLSTPDKTAPTIRAGERSLSLYALRPEEQTTLGAVGEISGHHMKHKPYLGYLSFFFHAAKITGKCVSQGGGLWDGRLERSTGGISIKLGSERGKLRCKPPDGQRIIASHRHIAEFCR